MKIENFTEPSVLALAINARRIGYALFEGLNEPTIWGIREFKNIDGCYDEARTLLQTYAPAALVLPVTDNQHSRLSQDVHEMVDHVAVVAGECDIEVTRFTRNDIRDCFSAYNATTKQEIAEAVGTVVPEFARCVPRPRKEWEGEQHSMILFDALSLIVTVYETERQQPEA